MPLVLNPTGVPRSLRNTAGLGGRKPKSPLFFLSRVWPVLGQVLEPRRQPAHVAAPVVSVRQHEFVARLDDSGHHVNGIVGRALDVDARLVVVSGNANPHVLYARLAQRAGPLLKNHRRALGVADEFQLDRSASPRRGSRGQQTKQEQ